MNDLPAGFLRAESRWLEEPDYEDADALEAAYDDYCDQQYEFWRDEQLRGDDD